MIQRPLLIKIFFKVILPLLILYGLISIFYKKPTEINYMDDNYIFAPFTDRSFGGNTDLETETVEDKKIAFTYTLSDKLDYPYAVLEIANSDYKLMDFSGYDYIKVKVETKVADLIQIQMYLSVDGYTDINKHDSHFPVSYFLDIEKDKSEYIIPIKYFTPHTWWFTLYNVSENDFKNYSYDSVITLNIQNNPEFPKGVEDTITFETMKLYTSTKKVVLISILSLLFYYIVFTIIYLTMKRFNEVKNNREKILLPYHTAQLPDKDDNESFLENYICKNYTNSQLSIIMVEGETGIPERDISKILKKRYNYSFPGFVNLLRITEAKRLLKETNEKILDISMAVGYNSLGHFNRTFKNLENITPREYRNKYLK